MSKKRRKSVESALLRIQDLGEQSGRRAGAELIEEHVQKCAKVGGGEFSKAALRRLVIGFVLGMGEALDGGGVEPQTIFDGLDEGVDVLDGSMFQEQMRGTYDESAYPELMETEDSARGHNVNLKNVEKKVEALSKEARRVGRTHLEKIGGTLVAVDESGRLWIGFLTPDQYGRVEQVEKEDVAKSYEDWHTRNFLGVMSVLVGMSGAGAGHGGKDVGIFNEEDFTTRRTAGLVDIGGMYIEESEHGIFEEGKAVTASICLVKAKVATLGCVIGSFDKRRNLVRQRNIFVFAHEVLRRNPGCDVEGFVRGIGEALAIKEGIKHVVVGSSGINMCPEHKQMVCMAPEMESAPLRPTGTLQ